MAVGSCGDGSIKTCIYIGDIGERGGDGAVNMIYKVIEPREIKDDDLPVESTLFFSWDQADAETLMAGPDGVLYIVSKVGNGAGMMGELPVSAWGNAARFNINNLMSVNISSGRRDPVGGDISPDGTEVLIKMRGKVYYWKLDGNESYETALQGTPTELRYTEENQGEAICWSATGSGYYTLSEGRDETLYYYVRRW